MSSNARQDPADARQDPADPRSAELTAVILQLTLDSGEPIGGFVGFADEQERLAFRGWVDLMSAINNLRMPAGGPTRRAHPSDRSGRPATVDEVRADHLPAREPGKFPDAQQLSAGVRSL